MKQITLDQTQINKIEEISNELNDLRHLQNKLNTERHKCIIEALKAFDECWIDCRDDEEIDYPFEYRNKHARMINFRVMGIVLENEEVSVLVLNDEGETFKTPYWNVELDTDDLLDILNEFIERVDEFSKYKNEIEK